MPEAVITSAVRTPIGTAFKGTLSETTAEELALHVLREAVRRSGLGAEQFDDVVLGESMYGGGDLARHAAVAAGMIHVPGVAVNRHCASGLTAISMAAAGIRAGMDRAVVAGGVQSFSTAPRSTWRVPLSDDTVEGTRPTFPYTADATDETSISVGWNVARKFGISREQMDAWALRSHQRAVAAIENGTFVDEITPIKVPRRNGSRVAFATDEHPRPTTSAEKLAALKPLRPDIEGFSITAGNASGVNDGASALAVVSEEFAAGTDATVLATVRAWASAGVDPAYTGVGAIDAASKVLARSGLSVSDIDLWEINEAFASVPVAACQELRIDEDRVNVHGSGCSLGHPIAASGARMVTTLVHELRRRGGGLGLAAMCAGAGQGGALVVEVR